MNSMASGTCYTIFDATTRRPLQRVTCCDSQLHTHLKPGLLAIEGRFNWSSVLGDDGTVSSDGAHAAAVEREQQRSARLARIAELERNQLRPMRELQIDANNAAARARLAEIDEQITQLRASMTEVR